MLNMEQYSVNRAVRFQEFNQKSDNWDNYIERLNYCFEANGIVNDSAKRANFFTVCGVQVYETLLALITPRKSNEVTFQEIVTCLTKHYSPKPNEISTSYKFYKRDQKPGESASEYIAQLRKLSVSCNFKDLERMLRDRLVCGMLDQKLQYELLKKDSLEYSEVIDAMFSAESAGRDMRMIQGTSASVPASSALCVPTLSDNMASTSAPEPMDINAMRTNMNIRFCYRCGDRHTGECRFINAICRFCKKKGHLEKICIAKKKATSTARNVNFTEEERLNGIYNFNNRSRVPPYEVAILLEGIPVVMQVDTGASFSLVNETTWRKLRHYLPHLTLHSSPILLRTWTDTPVKLLGKITLRVSYKDIQRDLTAIVAKGNGPNLLGRDWLEPLEITLKLHFVSEEDLVDINDLITKYGEVFKEGLGTYRGHPVAIHLRPNETPKFLKARPVPYAIKARVEKEIDRLVSEGVLKPTAFSEWATPVVPIIKRNGDIRLCGDYRSTVNQTTESDTYPMPTANEVFATVAGGKFFSTLDLERAYTQVTVDDNTSKLLTLNTCKGLYTVHRLAFGVKASPGIFQRLMTSLLAGIPGVAVLIDDIIVSGQTMMEMRHRLDTVLYRIAKSGLRLNKAKCKFAKDKVEFLGFIIDAEGIHPAPSKVDSIMKTPEPKNIAELQAFLGLYNFYERFIPHKATLLEPLHRLLDRSRDWRWTQVEQSAFDTAKRLLTCELTLVHYSLDRQLILTCDSSEYGVGAVISHVMDDGQEHPIAMGSRTLHTHERRYSQLDKEAAAIMFGIQKFHNYLMGRHFLIVTDHKPLLGIFDPKKSIPNMLSPRLTRIAIALTSYSYDITYRPGTQIGNADSLSRWPQPVPEEPETQLYEILLIAEKPGDFSVEAEQIALESKKDRILSKVIHHMKCGWPAKVIDNELRTYWLHRNDLSLAEDCILLGCRVVVPSCLRRQVLQVLHNTHDGIVKTKALARSYVWWPHLNEDIEELVRDCRQCAQNQHMPPKSCHEWIAPTRPWSRIHVDFAGPFQNKLFFIVVDAYSRWPEVIIINNMHSNTVVKHLRNLFATHGLCETLVSDNGTPFVSKEMSEFLAANKIKHITTAPYHPATNGLAERMVQTVKDKLRKLEGADWDMKIPRLLLSLRTTPCTSTQKSPAERLMNRRLRTLLDNIHPDNIQTKKIEQQIEENAQKKHRTQVGQNVMYRNYGSGPKWMPGRVIDKGGPSSYKIRTENTDEVINRHIDQLVRFGPQVPDGQEETEQQEENMTTQIEGDGQIDTELEHEEDIRLELQPEPQQEEIVEIPSTERWEEMLGIPNTAEVTYRGGKLKQKHSFYAKSPYARNSYLEEC